MFAIKYKLNAKHANLFKKFLENCRPIKIKKPAFDPQLVKNRLFVILSSKSESFD